MASMSGVSAGTIYANLKLNSSLDKDVRKASSNLDNLSKKFAVLGVAGAAAAVAITAKFVRMAAEEEVVSRRTAALLKAQGIMWDDVSESLDAYLKDLERMTAFNDTELQESFNTLIVSGLSYTEALESMNTVTSMAFSLNRDLKSMALLVGKAYNGQTGELSRYGIVLDQTLDQTQRFGALQAYVNENFADASDRTDTLQGQMDVLKNSMFNIAEAMGAELLPGLIENLEALNKWGDEGGWKSTADALKIIAELMSNIAESAAFMKKGFDVLHDGYTLTTGEKDSMEYQEAWMRARFGRDAGAELGVTPGRFEFALPVGGPSPPPGITPPPTQVIGGFGGAIPGYAGKQTALEATGGGADTIYAGRKYEQTRTGLSAADAPIKNMADETRKSNELLQDVVDAVNNVSIRAGGGMGTRGAPTTDPPSVESSFAIAKRTYGASGLGALRF